MTVFGSRTGPPAGEMMPPSEHGLRSRRKGISLACLAMAAPLLVGFDLPSTGIEGLGAKVADEDLAEMRGKFVNTRGVSYFGLQLQTSWQGMDGITTYATILFDVSFTGGIGKNGATPQMLIGWTRDCAGCGDAAMDVVGFGPAAQDGYVAIMTSSGVMPIGGLGTVQGAVQSHNINGSDNRVRNDMSIAVVPVSAVQGLNGQDLAPVTSSTSQTFADGDTVQFIIDSNAVALALTSGSGPDAIRQSVDGNLNQAAQHVLLASNLNNIHNSVGITIGVDELRQMDRFRVDNALSVMKGRGF